MSPAQNKKRIAISQRYDQVPGRNEWRDALDAQWAALLESLNFVPVLIPGHLVDVAGYLAELNIDGLILSGGNDIGLAPQRDNTEAKALAYADKFSLPVLGVCRGMQFLVTREGGLLQPCEGHVACYHALEGAWASEQGILHVNSYHNLAIFMNDCPGIFEVLASTSDGVVEALRHQVKNWLGIMWHPEREAPFNLSDLNLIQCHFQNSKD